GSRPGDAAEGALKAAVVGGGLAGLAAALELVDAGHEVALYEARPTLGGAVQTLPEREGDPAPPPDNGQHIALGCFHEYLRFLDRIGEGGSYRRQPLSLAVIGEDGRAAAIGRSPLSIVRYRHLPRRERLSAARVLFALRRAHGRDDETFGSLLRRLGASDLQVERFWDVFVRPALNLRTDEASAAMGVFTVRTALLGRASAADEAARLDARHGRRAGAGGGGRTRARRAPHRDPGRAGRGRGRGRAAAGGVGTPARRVAAGACVLAHRLGAPALRPAHPAAATGGAARLARPLGVRPRCAHGQRAAGRRAVPHRRRERRPRPARHPRPPPRRADGGRADRPAGAGRAALVAREPGAARDRRAAPGHRPRATWRRDEPPAGRSRRGVDGHGLAGDDGGSGPQRPCGGT